MASLGYLYLRLRKASDAFGQPWMISSEHHINSIGPGNHSDRLSAESEAPYSVLHAELKPQTMPMLHFEFSRDRHVLSALPFVSRDRLFP